MIELLRPEYRRFRLLLAAILAAVVTPPDPWIMATVMVPLFAIGEIVVVFVRWRLLRP